MLKSKNQVTLFVNYSYNSFYDFRSSDSIRKANRGLRAKTSMAIMGAWILYVGLYMNIP